MAAVRRIHREIEEVEEAASKDQQNVIYSVSPDKDDIYNWSGYIFGPTKSPYEGGAFKITIAFPPNYPFKPPIVTFNTKVYHPNISKKGAICLDILKDKWSPALTLTKVLMSISSLLTDPNPNDPLDIDVAKVYRASKQEFEKRAAEWTQLYARG